MPVQTYRVSVIWDPADDTTLSHILVQADTFVTEASEPMRAQYLLEGKLMLDVPEANYKGHAVEE